MKSRRNRYGKLTGPADPRLLDKVRRLDRLENDIQRPELLVGDLRAVLQGKRLASEHVFEPRPSYREPSSPTFSPRATSFVVVLLRRNHEAIENPSFDSNSSTRFDFSPTDDESWILVLIASFAAPLFRPQRSDFFVGPGLAALSYLRPN